MPSAIFDSTLSGSGSSAISGTRVFYVAWDVIVPGPQVRNPNLWDTTAVVGIGHFNLGNDVSSLGILSGVAYAEDHWMGAILGQWIAPPGIIGTEFSAAIADHIQWSISPGTSVHLYVFGDV